MSSVFLPDCNLSFFFFFCEKRRFHFVQRRNSDFLKRRTNPFRTFVHCSILLQGSMLRMLENIFSYNLIHASMSRVSLFLPSRYPTREISILLLSPRGNPPLLFPPNLFPRLKQGREGKIVVRFQKKSSSHSRLFQPCP